MKCYPSRSKKTNHSANGEITEISQIGNWNWRPACFTFQYAASSPVTVYCMELNGRTLVHLSHKIVILGHVIKLNNELVAFYFIITASGIPWDCIAHAYISANASLHLLTKLNFAPQNIHIFADLYLDDHLPDVPTRTWSANEHAWNTTKWLRLFGRNTTGNPNIIGGPFTSYEDSLSLFKASRKTYCFPNIQ